MSVTELIRMWKVVFGTQEIPTLPVKCKRFVKGVLNAITIYFEEEEEPSFFSILTAIWSFELLRAITVI